MMSARVEGEVMRRSFRRFMAVLAFGFLAAPAAAQEAEIRRIGEDTNKALIRIRREQVNSDHDSFSGLLIDRKGLVLVLWSSACMPSAYEASFSHQATKAKLVGVHPHRNLALMQLEMPEKPDPHAKPIELATSPSSVGDALYLVGPSNYYAKPCTVASETSPTGKPEYFWVAPAQERDVVKDRAGVTSWSGGLRAGELAINLRGQAVGLATDVIVNGKAAVRFMPLHDIQPRAFIDPKDRPVDHNLVRELLQSADDMQDVKKRGAFARHDGQWSAQLFLRMALAEDPANPEIYKRLGLNYKGTDNRQSATSFLARAIQMNPWDESSVDNYLGFGQAVGSLAMPGSHLPRRSDAIAVWKEGAAKFPTSNKLWEALAKGHFDNSEFYQAARATRLAVATFSSRTREMADLYEKSKLRLSDRETADLRQLEGSLAEHLRKLVEEAATGRKESRAFMTDEGKRVILGEKSVTGGEAGGKPAPPDPSRGMTSKQVEDSFVSTRLILAMGHLKEGRLKAAEEILEDVVKNYPNAETTQMARELLQGIRNKK